MYHNTIIYDLIKLDFNDKEIERHVGLQIEYPSNYQIERLGTNQISSRVLNNIVNDLDDDDFIYDFKIIKVLSSDSTGKTSEIDMTKPFRKPKVKKKKANNFRWFT